MTDGPEISPTAEAVAIFERGLLVLQGANTKPAQEAAEQILASIRLLRARAEIPEPAVRIIPSPRKPLAESRSDMQADAIIELPPAPPRKCPRCGDTAGQKSTTKTDVGGRDWRHISCPCGWTWKMLVLTIPAAQISAWRKSLKSCH